MVTGFRKLSRRLTALLILSLLLGCTPTQIPYVFLQYGSDLRQANVAKVLAENPLGHGENTKFTTLGRGQGSSHHVVQVRDREVPHVHRVHDLTFILVRGRGYLFMDKLRIALSAGDIAHVPRGASHYYVNTDFEPSVAFVIFTPPYDDNDAIPLNSP